jgi:hypothetical protein
VFIVNLQLLIIFKESNEDHELDEGGEDEPEEDDVEDDSDDDFPQFEGYVKTSIIYRNMYRIYCNIFIGANLVDA